MNYRHDVMVVDDTQLLPVSNSILLTKFGLSEKRTKFGKNLSHGFDKSADLLSKSQNHAEDFFKLCVLFKKFKLSITMR